MTATLSSAEANASGWPGIQNTQLISSTTARMMPANSAITRKSRR
jgi:hypothetical protein